MIATPSFVFIHMFRTGGTSINKFINGKKLGYHRPRSLIPKEYTHLPVVGNVRDPFDWYADVYFHALNFLYPMKTPTFLNSLLDFKRYSFKESIRRLVDTSWMTAKDKEKSMAHFPEDYNWKITLTDNLRKKDFQSYLDSDMGYLSWLFNYMYSDKGSLNGMTYCRLEHLEEDWASFLSLKEGMSLPHLNAMSGVNDIVGKVKEPKPQDCMSLYDDDLIKLIMKKDKPYFDFFGI